MFIIIVSQWSVAEGNFVNNKKINLNLNHLIKYIIKYNNNI